MKRKTALTIAVSNCSGGAGIQGKIMTMNGIFSASGATALAAPNTTGVKTIQQLDLAFLKQQISLAPALIRDLLIEAALDPGKNLFPVDHAFDLQNAYTKEAA